MHRALTDEVFDHLQGAPLLRLGRALGLSGDETAQAVVAALPLLVGGLACSFRRDDDPTLAGRFTAGGIENAVSLADVFGANVDAVIGGLGQATGLGFHRAHMLLDRLAPAVQERVARRVEHVDALRPLLEREHERITQRGGVASRLLSQLVECGAADMDPRELSHLAPAYPGGALQPALR